MSDFLAKNSEYMKHQRRSKSDFQRYVNEKTNKDRPYPLIRQKRFVPEICREKRFPSVYRGGGGKILESRDDMTIFSIFRNFCFGRCPQTRPLNLLPLPSCELLVPGGKILKVESALPSGLYTYT